MSDAPDDIEYRGLVASSWDLLRGDTSEWPDREFYRRLLLDGGQPALDVGCGTGRLLLEYVVDGLDVEGLDVSPEMLALCREKADALGVKPTLHLGAIEELKLERLFKTILVPSSSIQLITEEEAARAAMRRLYTHLAAGGRLAMSFMIFWREGRPLEHSWHVDSEAVRPADGRLVRRWCRSVLDPERQHQDTWDRYEVLDGEEVIQSECYERRPAARWYSLGEAIELYRTAGFVDVRAVRGFTDEAALAEDDLFTVIGTRG